MGGVGGMAHAISGNAKSCSAALQQHEGIFMAIILSGAGPSQENFYLAKRQHGRTYTEDSEIPFGPKPPSCTGRCIDVDRFLAHARGLWRYGLLAF